MSKVGFLALGLPSLAIALTACPGIDQLPIQGTYEDSTSVHLSLSPSSLKLEAGESASVNVSIRRPSGLNHEVIVRFSDLPEGVSASTVIVPAGADHVAVMLRATQEASTKHPTPATVTAQTDASSSSTPLYVAVTPSSILSQVNASFSNRTSNANTRNLEATSAYANFKGSLCQVTATAPGRGVYVCLTAPFAPGKTYRLVEPDRVGAIGTASVTYFETETGSSQNRNPRAWDSNGGTLTIDAITPQRLEFRTFGATMTPAGGFAGNLATGNFTLELTASIKDVSNL